MTVLTPVRRVAAAVSLTAAVVLAAGCSSSTSGSGSPFGGSTGGHSGGGFSTQAQSGGSAPGGGGGAASSSSTTSGNGGSSGGSSGGSNGGSGGGSSSAFCTKLQDLGTNIPDLSNQSAIKAIADKWKSLADSAPPEIKNEVQQVADALESVASGNFDPNKVKNVSSAFPKITAYLSQHCI